MALFFAKSLKGESESLNISSKSDFVVPYKSL